MRWSLLALMGFVWALVLIDSSASVRSCSALPGDLQLGTIHFRIALAAFPAAFVLLLGAVSCRKHGGSILPVIVGVLLVAVSAATAVDPLYGCFELREGCETHRYLTGLVPEVVFDITEVPGSRPSTDEATRVEVRCLSDSCAYREDRASGLSTASTPDAIEISRGETIVVERATHFFGRGRIAAFQVCKVGGSPGTLLTPHSTREHNPWSFSSLLLVVVLHPAMFILLLLGYGRLLIELLEGG